MANRWPANEASVGLTASAVMSYIDKMIRSAPSKAEAERRITLVIGHATARRDHLSDLWRDRCHHEPGVDCPAHPMTVENQRRVSDEEAAQIDAAIGDGRLSRED